LFLASGYAFAIRARRLVTGGAAASTAVAIVVLLMLLRAAVLAVSALDAASVGLPDRALALRLGVATALFAGVIAIAGLLGVRLGLGLPVKRYLHLPYRFDIVYRCHLLWSLAGWWLVLTPLFFWLMQVESSRAGPAALVRGVSWLAVVVFVLCTNATADAVGSVVELRFRRGWRWVLAATGGLALMALLAKLSPADWPTWGLSLLIRWMPPHLLLDVFGAEHWRTVIGAFLTLAFYTGLAVWAAMRLGRRVHLTQIDRTTDAGGTGDVTVFIQTWQRARSVGLPSTVGALVAREALLFVRARRLRFICATALIITFGYGLDPGGMSPLSLSVLLCFPLALLTAVFNNAFGFDRGGALAYLALPVAPGRIFLAKGAVFGVVTVLLTLAGAVPVSIALGTPPAARLGAFCGRRRM
jgi:hypothetical protein